MNDSVPLFVMLRFVPKEPVVPLAPSCSVPALMVVWPSYVLVPDNICVPEPCFVKLPVPEMTPEKSCELPSSMVSVALPNRMLPSPASENTVASKPSRSKMPLPLALMALLALTAALELISSVPLLTA